MFTHKHPTTKKLLLIYTSVVLGMLCLSIVIIQTTNLTPNFLSSMPNVEEGKAIDSLNGIPVYYNGAIDHFTERNLTKNGYNLGLKWQCVEFVKRYYYYHLNHTMPETKGNAKDFFNDSLPDASYNEQRALVQYSNGSLKKPAVDDIIVFDSNLGNKYGHIAIISAVGADYIQLIQQNAGPSQPTRETIKLDFNHNRWRIMNKRVLGWMRIE